MDEQAPKNGRVLDITNILEQRGQERASQGPNLTDLVDSTPAKVTELPKTRYLNLLGELGAPEGAAANACLLAYVAMMGVGTYIGAAHGADIGEPFFSTGLDRYGNELVRDPTRMNAMLGFLWSGIAGLVPALGGASYFSEVERRKKRELVGEIHGERANLQESGHFD